MSVAIVCDSSVDLAAEVLEQHGLRPAPVGYSLGSNLYLQGEQSHQEFYDALASGQPLTINGVSSESWETAYKAAAEGHEDGVVCLCQAFGSNSPSFDFAEYAARRMNHFEDLNVRVHQTPRSTAGQAAIALALARVAGAGGNLEDVERALDHVTGSADIFMITPDVHGLERAGELPLVTSSSGLGPLDFGVPVFRARDRIKAVDLADDTEQAEEMLLNRAADILGGAPSIVVVTHALAPDAAARLRDKASSRLNLDEIHVTELGPTVGGMLGTGAWGMGFCNAPPA